MLEDAIVSIRHADEAAARRHNARRARRRPVRLLDYWLGEVEMLMERNVKVVPEPLLGEIGRFLGKWDPRLYRRLRRKGPEAARVLDVLFEAEEEILPGGQPGLADEA